jgi:glycosyltransferase involved in cell wall biosynthesis
MPSEPEAALQTAFDQPQATAQPRPGRYASLSVIVPTYNRPQALARLLDCLAAQTYPPRLWNVIVVDDGSTDPGYAEVYRQPRPFELLTLRQQNQGAAAARNAGADCSQADILVFLDDDVVVEPGYLAGLVQEHNAVERAVVMGFFRPAALGRPGAFKTAVLRSGVTQDQYSAERRVDFTHVASHNLSLKRQHFYEIGMFQDPTQGRGWPNWDDIDLAYRAHRQGFEFIQAHAARGAHIDHVLDDFQAHCQRIYRAGANAHWLFARYPELQEMLPMFRDKTPIRLGKDPLRLALRKLLRRALAWGPALALMQAARRILERAAPESRLLPPLYRWINSTYIYRGYRQGAAAHLGEQ